MLNEEDFVEGVMNEVDFFRKFGQMVVDSVGLLVVDIQGVKKVVFVRLIYSSFVNNDNGGSIFVD